MTGPSEDELAELADAILSIARKLSLRSDHLEGVISLSGTETEVIRAIHLNPGMSATEVAARTGLQRSNVSATLRVLEAHGLITKRRASVDARAIELVATEAAITNLERVRAGWAARLRLAGDDVLLDGIAARPLLARMAERLDLPPGRHAEPGPDQASALR